MPNRIFFFSDIDDTLIQTKRKTDFSKNTIVASYTKEGEENSFFYEGIKLFVDTIINAGMTFIPTTARNLASYERTILYNNPAIKYVILNFGGLLLVDNKEDQAWTKAMNDSYSKITPLSLLYTKISQHFRSDNLKLQVKIIDSYYISIYNKFDLDNPEMIKNIRESLETFLAIEKDFYLYENGNSFALLPHFLNKKFAVEHLIKIHKPLLTIGAGDNISDLDFMQVADFKFLPDKCFI
jgi:hydroxymethylpyrimidine pyrophosphatase-like HAD family hydrolase